MPTPRDDEAALTADIIALAVQYGRYGYRRITAMLWRQGWTVNVKRVERIWRREVRNPVQRGHCFQHKADSNPVIADSL